MSPGLTLRRRRGRSPNGSAKKAVVAGLGIAIVLATPSIADARMIGNFNVGGAIEVEYDQAGGFNMFGNPTTAELNAANFGKFQVFERNNSIYWHADTGAHQVGGRIRDKWSDLGWENGNLHYPITRERDALGGRFNNFQGGSIYWSSATDAHNVQGLIYQKWADNNWERGPLGFPASDEFSAGNGSGKGNHFQNKSSIYWTSGTGAHTVIGEIRDAWEAEGWENGKYGYPTSDAYDFEGGKKQDFQNGAIVVDPFEAAVDPVVDGDTPTTNAQFADDANYPAPRAGVGREVGGQSVSFSSCPAPVNGKSACLQSQVDDPTVARQGGPQEAPEETAPGTSAPTTSGNNTPTSPPALPEMPDPTPGTETTTITVSPESTEVTTSAESGVRTSESAAPESTEVTTSAEPGDAPSESLVPEAAPEARNGPLALPPGVSPGVDPSPTMFTPAECLSGIRDGLWKAYRKQSCSIRVVPMVGKTEGVPTLIRPYTIFQGVLTSQKSGEWRQEFRILAGADFGIQDVQTLEISVNKKFLGSYSTELGESIINVPMTPGQTRSIVFIWKPILTDNGIFNFKPVLSTYIKSAVYGKTNTVALESEAVRCDTTLKKGGINGGYRPGCVISRVRPELNFDDQSIAGDMTEQAGHIGLAIESGLPGSRTLNKPLTRLADKAAIDSNRRVSCPTSGKIRDGRFLSGHQCDEYPFAATYQGSVSGGGGGGSGRTFNPECHVPDLSAGTGSVGYSICMISALHNSRGGTALLKLYAYNRVIAGDPFFVYGTPSRPQ